MMTEMLNEETVAGGIDGARHRLRRRHRPGLQRRPKAHMYMEGGFVGGITLADVNPNVKPGESIDFYPFVKIDEAQGEPLVGGGDTAAFVNNQDVSKLVEYLASPKRVRSGSRRVRSSRRTRASSSRPTRMTSSRRRPTRSRTPRRSCSTAPTSAGCAGRGLGHAAPDRDQGPEQGSTPREEFQANAKDAFAG